MSSRENSTEDELATPTHTLSSPTNYCLRCYEAQVNPQDGDVPSNTAAVEGYDQLSPKHQRQVQRLCGRLAKEKQDALAEEKKGKKKKTGSPVGEATSALASSTKRKKNAKKGRGTTKSNLSCPGLKYLDLVVREASPGQHQPLLALRPLLEVTTA